MIRKYNKNNLVWTSDGPQLGQVKSLAGQGETIFNPQDDTASYISEGTKGKDTVPTNVDPGDENGILGNNVDWRDGYTFADKAAPHSQKIESINNAMKKLSNNRLGRFSSQYKNTLAVAQREAEKAKKPSMDYLQNLSDQQGAQKQYEYEARHAPLYDEGKTPWYVGALPGILGVSNALMQLNHYATEPIKYHNTYYDNPYERRVIEGLGGLRQQLYPKLRGVYDAERRGQYALNNMGGLTSGQRAANRVALALGTQRNVADVIAANQDANIGLKSNYYKTMGELGQQQRAARMNAAQHDWADFVAAHGAKTKGIETGMANLQQSIGNWYQNRFKYSTWQDTLDLYKQQVNNEQKRYLDEIEVRKAEAAAKNKMYDYTMTSGYPMFNPSDLDYRFISFDKDYWTDPRNWNWRSVR